MKGILLDENVPSRLSFVPTAPVMTVRTLLGESATDKDVWEFARKNHYVILTKYTDFSDLSLAGEGPPPWVIHFAIRQSPEAGLS